MSEKKIDALSLFADTVINQLDSMENETFPWVKDWSTLDVNYRNALTNRSYNGLHNIVSCMLSGFSDCRYLTFNQTRKAGGSIKKGSKGIRIIYWNFFKKFDEKKEEEVTIPFAKFHTVFNVEQIEGIEFPEINTDVINENIKEDKRVEEIFTSLNVKSNVSSDQISNGAYYNPIDDSITLPNYKQFKSNEGFIQTSLHELVHWCAKRVGEECKDYSNNIKSRAKEELVAELGSMYLCMIMGIDGWMNSNNLIYIKNWKEMAGDKKNFVYSCCRSAEKRVKYIIENAGIENNIFENKKEDESVAA